MYFLFFTITKLLLKVIQGKLYYIEKYQIKRKAHWCFKILGNKEANQCLTYCLDLLRIGSHYALT